MIEVVGLGRAQALPGDLTVPEGLAAALGAPGAHGAEDGMRLGLLGSPEAEDPAFLQLKEEAARRGIDVRVRWGEPLAQALSLPAGRTVFGASGVLPGELLLPGAGPFAPRRHGIVDPHEELLIWGDVRGEGRTVLAGELEGTPLGDLAAIHRPRRGAARAVDTLLGVMAALRSPTGCAWDREQDHLSLRRYILEEAAEAVDAIEGGDIDKIREELGDLLLQVVFQARIYEEEGAFDFAAVAKGLAAKLMRRHPHVFGDEEAKDVADVEKLWRQIKAAEASESARAMVDEVARSLPAFERLCGMLRLAMRLGIDTATLPLPAPGVVRETQALILAGREPGNEVRDAVLLLEAGLAAVGEAALADVANHRKSPRDRGKAAFFLGIEAKLAGKKKD